MKIDGPHKQRPKAVDVNNLEPGTLFKTLEAGAVGLRLMDAYLLFEGDGGIVGRRYSSPPSHETGFKSPPPWGRRYPLPPLVVVPFERSEEVTLTQE